ncbi:PaaI family thioesterase [Cytobacillus oceanisediminis]
MTTMTPETLAAYGRLVAACAQLEDILVWCGGDADELETHAGRLERAVAAMSSSLPVADTGTGDPVAAAAADPRTGVRDRSLQPPFRVRREDASVLSGEVRFRPHFAGVGSVHGGSLALFLDDMVGRLANAPEGIFARTAYLHVDYRRLTPVDEWLDYELRLDRVEGRKRFVRGEVAADGLVLAEVEALCVHRAPGAVG